MPVEGYIKKKQTEKSEKTSNKSNRGESQKADFTKLKNELVSRVRQKVISRYKSEELNDTEKMDAVAKDALNLIDEECATMNGGIFLDAHEKSQVLEKLMFTMFGYGVLDPLIKDPSVTEIMVNGLENIFIEKNGKLVIAVDSKGDNLKFDTPDELLYVVEKIVAPINRKVDDSNPIVDARLPNGFRVNIVLNVISLDGTVITIRKFPESPFTMENLVDKNSLPKEVADFLKTLVKARYNLFVSGGTGSGKTTFLNALSNYINKDERVITIEDAAELKIMGIKNLIRLETRPPNVEGKGAITMRDLLKSALRMRPDRIVVGEVRSGEALEMLQAMNTGHDGSLSTGHANTAADMLARLETMVLMAGVELPLISIRQQIATAIELIIHLGKLRDGTRRVLQITEILGVTQEGYVTQELFQFDPKSNKLLYTGNKLKQTYKLKFVKKDGEEAELGKAMVASSFSMIAKKFGETEGQAGEGETAELFSRFLKTKADVKKKVHPDKLTESTEINKVKMNQLNTSTWEKDEIRGREEETGNKILRKKGKDENEPFKFDIKKLLEEE
jgi:pilus assembly protein CpaF